MSGGVEWDARQWASLLIGSAIIIITLLGNLLVIVAVGTTKRLRSVTNCFVVSLAIADLLVAVLVLPMAVANELEDTWPLSQLACDLWISLDVLLCTASILNLCCISLDRYLAITRPLAYAAHRSKRLALLMIAIVWVAATAITCPPIFGWYEEGRNLPTSADPPSECVYISARGYVVYSACGSFFIPLAVMLYVYACIMRVISRREKELRQRRRQRPPRPRSSSSQIETDGSEGDNRHEMTTFTASGTTTTSDSGMDERSFSGDDTSGRSSSGTVTSVQPTISRNGLLMPPTTRRSWRPFRRNERRGERASFLREKKAAKTLAIVMGGFVFCWLPFFLVYVIKPFCPSCLFPHLLVSGLTWLGWFNSAINPFIYAFYNLDFRAAFWRLTCAKCCKPRGILMRRPPTVVRQIESSTDREGTGHPSNF